jgi:hypothetical protein
MDGLSTCAAALLGKPAVAHRMAAAIHRGHILPTDPYRAAMFRYVFDGRFGDFE